MNRQDLIELMRSTIDEDAIIGRLYHYFHLQKHYIIDELDAIIQYGIAIGELQIMNTDDEECVYSHIDWTRDNCHQEILARNPDKYIPQLFSIHPTLPLSWESFVSSPSA